MINNNSNRLDKTNFTLRPEAVEEFLGKLDNPPKPNEALVNLFSKKTIFEE